MKLMADVINLAINQYLWDGHEDYSRSQAKIFSCTAIRAANKHNDLSTEKIIDFLRSMGVEPDESKEFRSIDFGPRSQHARALWLTWAAMIAREEGKTL